MHSKKQAQSMSINVLIVAVLGLVVLIIIGSLFVSKTKKFGTDLESCAAKFGQCKTEADCRTSQGNPLSGTSCESDPKYKSAGQTSCCITPFETK